MAIIGFLGIIWILGGWFTYWKQINDPMEFGKFLIHMAIWPFKQ